MKMKLLDILCCPACRGDLELTATEVEAETIQEGRLVCGSCSNEYPIKGGIPRFVPAENYADNFGFQWNRFSTTQLDSCTGTTITRDRFLETTGWSPEMLEGKLVLDVGCGAGRFAEVALDCGAELVAIDYSSAVDACRKNLGHNPRLNVVQASIYELPFRQEAFDCVYCIGVLQHTPDVKSSLMCLPQYVKPGGEMAIDLYWKNRTRYMSPLSWIRPITKGISKERLFPICELMVKALFPLSLMIGRIPRIGRWARNIVPVYNHEGIFPLNPEQLKEWSLLNTFDRLSATYEYPQTMETLERWMLETKLDRIHVSVRPPLVARGRKPSKADGSLTGGA